MSETIVCPGVEGLGLRAHGFGAFCCRLNPNSKGAEATSEPRRQMRTKVGVGIDAES